MPYGEGNPEIEDGYAPLANEALEALAHTDLTGSECRCLFFLFRKTYGWNDKSGKNKKNDAIPYSQWVAGTGLDRRHVIRTLEGLFTKHIITKATYPRPGKNPVTVWGFQKKYHEWNSHHEAQLVPFQPPLSHELVTTTPPVSAQLVTTTPPEVVTSTPPVSAQLVTTTPPVSYEVVAPSAKLVTTAPLDLVTTAPPSTYKEHTISTYISLSTVLAQRFKERVLQNNPKAKVPEDLKKWANEFRLMLSVDKRTPAEISMVILFSQNDSFWKTNILSPGKLREKFDQLYLKAKAAKEKSSAEKKGEYHGANVAYKPQPQGTSAPPKFIDGDAEIAPQTN